MQTEDYYCNRLLHLQYIQSMSVQVRQIGETRLKDIAEQLNVSISTVSRALGKDTCEKVAPDLRLKILEVARQVNYVPHPAAQLMRKPRTQLLTVLMPLSTDSVISDYMNGILAGVITASRDLNMEVRVALLDSNNEDILAQVRHAAIGAGSIVLVGKLLSLRQLVKLEEEARPIVVMDACLPPNMNRAEGAVSTVGTNNRECFHELTLQLLKLGHRRMT